MGFNRSQRDLMGFNRIQWDLMGFKRIQWDLIGFNRDLNRDLTGSDRDLMGHGH